MPVILGQKSSLSLKTTFKFLTLCPSQTWSLFRISRLEQWKTGASSLIGMKLDWLKRIFIAFPIIIIIIILIKEKRPYFMMKKYLL